MLKCAVKESHLENDRHIDLSVMTADRRVRAETALMWARTYVARGDVTGVPISKKIWGFPDGPVQILSKGNQLDERSSKKHSH